MTSAAGGGGGAGGGGDKPGKAPKMSSSAVSLTLSSGGGAAATKSSSLNVVKGVLYIHHIDVGQGEATLIVFEKAGVRTVVLIDGGRATRGGETVFRYLVALGIKRIDWMICTHCDADHIEGLTYLLANGFPVTTVIRGAFVKEKDNKIINFLAAAAAAKARVVNASSRRELASCSFGSASDPELTCVSSGSGGTDDNALSLAFVLTFGAFTYYTGGDLESAGEDGLRLRHVCGFKCGHHGSRRSTSAAFLHGVAPAVALISCGKHGYQHPDDDLVQRLCEARSIQSFYLTNCHYNRAGINPAYMARRAEEISAVAATVVMTEENQAKIEAQLKATFDHTERSVRVRKGVVAGGSASLGTLILALHEDDTVGDPILQIGCMGAAGWAWTPHVCQHGAAAAAAAAPAPVALKSFAPVMSIAGLAGIGSAAPVASASTASPSAAGTATGAAVAASSSGAGGAGGASSSSSWSVAAGGHEEDEEDEDDGAAAGGWAGLVAAARAIPLFSLLPKMAATGERRVVRELSDDEYAYAMGADDDDDDDAGPPVVVLSRAERLAARTAARSGPASSRASGAGGSGSGSGAAAAPKKKAVKRSFDDGEDAPPTGAGAAPAVVMAPSERAAKGAKSKESGDAAKASSAASTTTSAGGPAKPAPTADGDDDDDE